MSSNESTVKEYYDEYVTQQAKIGINLRLLMIYDKLKSAGLKNGNSILEIGCGIGSLTSLIAAKNKKSSIVATDISSESIKFATQFLKKYKNVEFNAVNVLELNYSSKFDFIVLADVLEHIPVETHYDLFSKLKNLMHENSIIAINIPSPWYQEYTRNYNHEALQIIDQSIHSDNLLENCYKNNLYLKKLESYSIWKRELDYQWIVLSQNKNLDSITQEPKIKLVFKIIYFRLKYFFR